tara:strand:+ start:12909 stop:15107 length:2199 start_codon:yes stop_codon:yes gene_type:complete
MSLGRFGNTRSSVSSKDLVEEISRKVPRSEQLRILRETYPAGREYGKMFFVGSLSGEAGQSMKINIDTTSPHFMQGQDFNGNTGIGGIVKILMEARGMKLPQIKEMFSRYLDSDVPSMNGNAVVENPFQSAKSNADKAPVKQRYNFDTPYDSEYHYISEEGEVLVTLRRYNVMDPSGNPVLDDSGKPKKEFRPFLPGVAYSRQPSIKPLYNIPNILSSDRVIWVEGEKCADALSEAGYTATCTLAGASLTKNTKDQYDFTPLKGKELVIWPDNDAQGKKLAELIEELALNAGAKSVNMLIPPQGKPDKWDAYDAIQEGFDVDTFLKKAVKPAKKSLNLLDDSMLISRFAGVAPEQKFLVDDTFPLGVPIIFSAAGDAGKGMMTLDLGMKIASGRPMKNSFGGAVKEFGNVVIFTAEDDEAEMHRRISRLDPMGDRFSYQHDMKVVPLPNVGGVFAIMNENNGEFSATEAFEKIYEQILQIDNLKLIVFDPLASFVHADVNADPAAGAALMGLLAQIATETGASVLMCHHMTKIKDDAVIKTPEQARNLIRGTSALVDGVRSAFALWQVDTKRGRTVCEKLGIPYQRNRCFDGAVVKSNGPADRSVRHFIRDADTGLLEDWTDRIQSQERGTAKEAKLEALHHWILRCERDGVALTHSSGNNAVARRVEDADAPSELRGLAQVTLENYVRELHRAGRIEKYQLTRTGGKIWLGGVSGAMASQTYEARTAVDRA